MDRRDDSDTLSNKFDGVINFHRGETVCYRSRQAVCSNKNTHTLDLGFWFWPLNSPIKCSRETNYTLINYSKKNKKSISSNARQATSLHRRERTIQTKTVSMIKI